MTRWLRRLFARPTPLPGVSVEAHTRLAVELASLRQRVYALEAQLSHAEYVLAHERRLREALTEIAVRADRGLAQVRSQVDQPGSLSARLARIELWLMPPVSDGVQEVDEALDEALEAALMHEAEGDC